MPRHARVKSRSKLYHIIWRGANRQEVFHDDEDCKVFLDTMVKYKKKSGMRIYAWCLMSNHIHLLLREGDESLSVTIAQVKSLPRLQRNDILSKVKRIDGLSQRQAARILGVSPNLVFKA